MTGRISLLPVLAGRVILLPVVAGAGPAAGRAKPAATECSDEIDNSGEGKVDFRPGGKGDPACTSRNDETEGDDSPPAEVCGDRARQRR